MVVYGLHNGDGVVRYVGQTTQKVTRRLSHHLSHASEKRHSGRWINKSVADGKTIGLVVLEKTTDQKSLDNAERKWIQHFLGTGVALTNAESGGKRAYAAWNKGKQLSSETKTKLSTAVDWQKRRIVDQNGTFYDSVKQAAKILGLQRSNIAAVLRGKYPHTGGYAFKGV